MLIEKKNLLIKISDNLIARSVNCLDMNFLFTVYSNKSIQQYALDEEDLEITPKMINKTINHFTSKENTDILFIIERENMPVGIFMIYNFSPKNKHSKVGMALLPEYRKLGIAKQTIPKLIEFSFNTLHVKKLFGEVYENNSSSLSMLISLNFMKEAVLKEHVYRNNQFMDMCIYSIFNPENKAV